MSNGAIDFQDVLQLIELIKSSSNFSEIRLRSGDVEVELRRSGASAPGAPPETALPAVQPASAASARAMPVPPASASASRLGATIIKAPMVGTVYRAPEPGATPFVTVGQSVSPGDPLCIIEVMKLMNTICAECGGVVSEVLVADGEAVRHGQELFAISTR